MDVADVQSDVETAPVEKSDKRDSLAAPAQQYGSVSVTTQSGMRAAVGLDVFANDAMHNGRSKDFRSGASSAAEVKRAITNTRSIRSDAPPPPVDTGQPLGFSLPPSMETSIASLSTIAFEPLDDRVYKAYLCLGLRTADWTARLSGLLMTWLMIIAPPFSVWMQCNSAVAFLPETISRSVASPFLAILFDAVGWCVELRVGSYDYESGMREYKDYGLTVKSFLFAALNTVSVLGMFILSDASPFLLGMGSNKDCYIIGRSR
ncbi:hypothetical protein HK101_008359 [Irineochytrium annulatum]|nr:hypothetical protein HK101_008359 [Irineochytrium annulatum]